MIPFSTLWLLWELTDLPSNLLEDSFLFVNDILADKHRESMLSFNLLL